MTRYCLDFKLFGTRNWSPKKSLTVNKQRDEGRFKILIGCQSSVVNRRRFLSEEGEKSGSLRAAHRGARQGSGFRSARTYQHATHSCTGFIQTKNRTWLSRQADR